MDFKSHIKDWRLYVITDEPLSRGRNHFQIAQAAIEGGANVIQYRDKTASSRKMYEDALQLQKLCRKKQIPFIVNDRLDIALAVDADGLHVGQKDLPASVARKWLGQDKILGVSAETLEQAIAAEKDGADYLGVGPVFEARRTKPDTIEPLGLSLLSDVNKHCQKPIVAIGGIKNENAAAVIEAGADCVAVISAIVSAENIADAARQIKNTVEQMRKN